MADQRRALEDYLYGTGNLRRYTQDSPVLPDVWLAYGAPTEEGEDSTEKLGDVRDLHFSRLTSKVRTGATRR